MSTSVRTFEYAERYPCINAGWCLRADRQGVHVGIGQTLVGPESILASVGAKEWLGVDGFIVFWFV